MSLQHLRTGDKALVQFRFIKNPEYLKTGMKLVFREGRTKAIGTVTNANPPPLIPPTSTAVASNSTST